MIILRCCNCFIEYNCKCPDCGSENIVFHLATRYDPPQNLYACDDCLTLFDPPAYPVKPHFCSDECKKEYENREKILDYYDAGLSVKNIERVFKSSGAGVTQEEIEKVLRRFRGRV